MSMIPDEGQIFEPGRGHNQPPGMLPLEQAVLALKEMLNEQTQDSGRTFAQRKEEFLRSARNAVVRDRETAGAAGDIIKLAGRVWDRIAALRLERSNPYRDVASALGAAAEDFWQPVADEMETLLAKINEWTRAEDKRIADQAAEQQREFEAMRAAAQPAQPSSDPLQLPLDAPAAASAPPPPREEHVAAPIPATRKKIRGDLGATISAAQDVTYTVSDVRALPDHILNAAGVHAAIIAAVKGTVKVMGVPPGISTSTATTNKIR